ncbi:MAG: hypothetical protein A3B31_02360 [Candidatus Komeilibacteria bacterium RIFCSPLOWO2_01_FULL_53_11]|uniref:Uncharacterized protein n=1 Tax=Candidatus Komeilibacteria bacterium RIFCSPLOWO2_01_FULL_53_11 TaxID=1798552 RepID=A0A1G2BUB4_9BACT|nr:MAG: hypothetical protein A3B31_02360 [Candidatus Komeilibacteria bacterium RIFCSPLOWO2_01_FULL_53_11]
MGLFNALTGKIYRFNKINMPIYKGINDRISALDDSTERLIVIGAFGITDEMIKYIFQPDNGIFKNQLNILTNNSLEKTYHTLLDAALSQLTKTPLINTSNEKIIDYMAKVTNSTMEQKQLDINNYNKAESIAMLAYEKICTILSTQDSSQGAIFFSRTFININHEIMLKLKGLMFNE